MNKNVPERGMPKARWSELKKTTSGGMGRTLRQQERLVRVSQKYTPVYVEEALTPDGPMITVLDHFEPVFKDITGKIPKGRTYFANRRAIKKVKHARREARRLAMKAA